MNVGPHICSGILWNGTMRFQKANPWLRNSKKDQMIAAVEEPMQFTHTISVRLSTIYDIWKRRYDCLTWCNLFLGFQQANLAKLRLRITSLPGIACQCRTWPGHWEGFKLTGQITGQRQGDPLCNPSVNLCQQSKPHNRHTNYIQAVFRQIILSTCYKQFYCFRDLFLYLLCPSDIPALHPRKEWMDPRAEVSGAGIGSF